MTLLISNAASRQRVEVVLCIYLYMGQSDFIVDTTHLEWILFKEQILFDHAT